MSTILWSFGIWSQLERWKSLIGACFMSWLQIKKKKKSCIVPSSFILCNNNEPFFSSWTEKNLQSTSQSQTYTKEKVIATVWWSATHLIHCSFLNPNETITYEKYAQHTSMRCTENCKTWSWHWSIEWAQFFSTASPDYLLHNQCLKSWMNWASKFCLIYHMHQTCDQPTTTSSILTLFTGKMHPQPERCTKMLSKSSWILKHRFLHYKNKRTYFLLSEMYWL